MGDDDSTKKEVLGKIIEGLKQQPAYLLIFGLCVLFVLFGGLSAWYGLATEQSLPTWLGFFSFVTALAGAVAVVYRVEQTRGAKTHEEAHLRYEKVLYVKVLHLSKSDANVAPAYRRYVERLGEEVPVYDEAVYHALNTFSEPQEKFTFTFRSSGVVDPRGAHPWMEKLEFADKDSQAIQNLVNLTIQQSSLTYWLISHHLNGLQPGHEDIGMRMDRDTDSARLVVDFSSLGNAASLMKGPTKAVLRTGDREHAIGIEKCAAGVYSITETHLKEGQVLRMDFQFDWTRG